MFRELIGYRDGVRHNFGTTGTRVITEAVREHLSGLRHPSEEYEFSIEEKREDGKWYYYGAEPHCRYPLPQPGE